MDHTIWLMDMDGYGYQIIFWHRYGVIWICLIFLLMDMDGYGFYKPETSSMSVSSAELVWIQDCLNTVWLITDITWRLDLLLRSGQVFCGAASAVMQVRVGVGVTHENYIEGYFCIHGSKLDLGKNVWRKFGSGSESYKVKESCLNLAVICC